MEKYHGKLLRQAPGFEIKCAGVLFQNEQHFAQRQEHTWIFCSTTKTLQNHSSESKDNRTHPSITPCCWGTLPTQCCWCELRALWAYTGNPRGKERARQQCFLSSTTNIQGTLQGLLFWGHQDFPQICKLQLLKRNVKRTCRSNSKHNLFPNLLLALLLTLVFPTFLSLWEFSPKILLIHLRICILHRQVAELDQQVCKKRKTERLISPQHS